MNTKTAIKQFTHDLITEIRGALEMGHADYASAAIADLRRLIRARHNTRINHLGWPTCLAG